VPIGNGFDVMKFLAVGEIPEVLILYVYNLHTVVNH